METVTYAGWPDCIRLSNGSIELIATVSVGPRIIRFGFIGGTNHFAEFEADLGRTGDPAWRPYGGHRLWHAPESVPRTYFPDNAPVATFWDGRTLELRPPPETTTGIAKAIRIVMDPGSDRVRVEHSLTNLNLWEIETSAWALSVMAAGGRAVLPQEPFVAFPDELLPARPLVLWTYTDMSDPRFGWGARFITLRQDAGREAPQKIGIRNSAGWGVYAREGEVFLKYAAFDAAARYPDFGCNWEVYTNSSMLELETLGPVMRLPPGGGAVRHAESWVLARSALDEADEKVLAAQMEPLLAAAVK